LISFLLGVSAFQVRDKLPYSPVLAIAAAMICVAVACFGPANAVQYPLVNLVAAPALTYLMVYLGVSRLPTPELFKRGDYSYGIYLYGMPMQQVMILCFPLITSAIIQLGLSMILIVPFAAFSWHIIERPVLKLRKKFSFVARVRLAADRTSVSAQATPPRP
jgi:peptidoglycan/LPS O-acetylase OafA/YrhL